MENKISHIKIKLLNVAFVFLLIGITISFIEIFLPLLSYGFGSKALIFDITASIISLSILIFINIFLPILSYTNLRKCSKKISVIVLILCVINICFNIFFIYIRLNNLPLFPFSFVVIDTIFAVILNIIYNIKIAFFVFLISTSLFLITSIFSIKKF